MKEGAVPKFGSWRFEFSIGEPHQRFPTAIPNWHRSLTELTPTQSSSTPWRE